MKTQRAMDIVGISLNDQESVFHTLADILHLGNIEFSPGKECDPDFLLALLCTRLIQTLEGNIIKTLAQLLVVILYRRLYMLDYLTALSSFALALPMRNFCNISTSMYLKWSRSTKTRKLIGAILSS